MTKLKGCARYSPEGNTREQQDIAGRTVVTDVVGFNAQSNFRPATTVPEPTSLTLLGAAGFGMMVARRRSQRRLETAG